MKHRSAFRQFAKDCPEHFDKEVLMYGHLRESNPIQLTKKAKTTRNSNIPNKF